METKHRKAARRIRREQETVSAMIRLYCKSRHQQGMKKEVSLCEECRLLEEYAHHKAARCHYGAAKGSCGRCKTPCYGPKEKEEIRQVMRATRVKMLWAHPVLTLYHMSDLLKSVLRKPGKTEGTQ